MTKYVRVKESYCGCISVQYFAILASCVTLAFQLTFSIFFLIYGELLGLIPMILTIANHLFFMFIIHQFNSPLSMTIYSGIEIAFAFTLLGFSIWILSWILDPKVSFVYKYCLNKLQYTTCYGGSQLVSLVWGASFAIFFFVSVLVIPVFRNTGRNIKAARKSSSVFINEGNNLGNPVQPIFNINSGMPPVSQTQQHIILAPQLFQQNVPQAPLTENQPDSNSRAQLPEAQLPSQQLSAPSHILSPMGVIHLNLYTIQLPTGNSTYETPNTCPAVDHSNACFSDSISQTGQTIEYRL